MPPHQPTDELFIGLMSGTSMDGIDAVLVRFEAETPHLLGHHHMEWPDETRANLKVIAHPGGNEIELLGVLDNQTATCFAQASLELLTQCKVTPSQVTAIGSHGQTIRHRPNTSHPFTLQIGNPSQIAELCGITAVADFRRRDMAAGGEGAPLVPAFHAAQFTSTSEDRIILNLGGIANITYLPADKPDAAFGFDTGPANTLLDYWIGHRQGKRLDKNGAWAAMGTPNPDLLSAMLKDPYFDRQPPKSTGPEHFSPAWLHQHLESHPPLHDEDIQATLTALTAESIKQAIEQHTPGCSRLIVCGGGVCNHTLIEELKRRLAEISVESSLNHGIDPNHVEATAFAWLARQTINRRPGNPPSATGAKHPVILGGIYPA